jgi:hypothetical protein
MTGSRFCEAALAIHAAFGNLEPSQGTLQDPDSPCVDEYIRIW